MRAVDRRDELARGFSRLSVEHRMALVLHHYLGLRPSDIARTLGIPEGTAASRLHYGLRALRAALDAEAVASGGTTR
jgi:RNA polymerase sigma-70 factor (ECF subfamily)